MNKGIPPQDPRDKWLLIISAWSSILLVSNFPDIISSMIFGEVPGWMFWGKVGLLGFFFGLCHLWRSVRPLRPYAFVMLVFYVALAVSDLVKTSVWWQGLISDTEPSFALNYLRPYIRNTGVALAVIAALWIAKRRRSEFFLVKGQLNAAIGPVRWLGIRQGESWRTFGWIFAAVAALAVAVPSLLPVRLSSDLPGQVVPLLPAVLLYSAINAFNEEIYFRTTLLSTLSQVIGRSHALLINVVFFGLAHYLNGSPPGMVGALMTGFLAWLLGKSMLETKGLFWPWFIHFLPDVVIFFSYAILWVQARP
jgi:membrane protease YdiL (CAAX protease family)